MVVDVREVVGGLAVDAEGDVGRAVGVVAPQRHAGGLPIPDLRVPAGEDAPVGQDVEGVDVAVGAGGRSDDAGAVGAEGGVEGAVGVVAGDEGQHGRGGAGEEAPGHHDLPAAHRADAAPRGQARVGSAGKCRDAAGAKPASREPSGL